MIRRNFTIAVMVILAMAAQLASAQTDKKIPTDSVRAHIKALMDDGIRLIQKQTSTSFDSALLFLDSARNIATINFGSKDSAVASALCELSRGYMWKGDHVIGDSLSTMAYNMWEETLGPDHPQTARGLYVRASYLWVTKNRPGEAEQLYLRAITILDGARFISS